MTPEQQNIAIAETMGFERGKGTSWVKDDLDGWLNPAGQFIGHDGHLPAYHSDLNTCAEFESALTDDEHYDYRVTLAYVVSGKPGAYGLRGFNRQYVSATAPQRCEAFLRVRGLWKEGA